MVSSCGAMECKELEKLGQVVEAAGGACPRWPVSIIQGRTGIEESNSFLSGEVCLNQNGTS